MLSQEILLLLGEYWKRYRPKEYLFEGAIPRKAILIGKAQRPPRFMGLTMMQILELLTGRDYSICPLTLYVTRTAHEDN